MMHLDFKVQRSLLNVINLVEVVIDSTSYTLKMYCHVIPECFIVTIAFLREEDQKETTSSGGSVPFSPLVKNESAPPPAPGPPLAPEGLEWEVLRGSHWTCHSPNPGSGV